jgi:hypothetical protein
MGETVPRRMDRSLVEAIKPPKGATNVTAALRLRDIQRARRDRRLLRAVKPISRSQRNDGNSADTGPS